MSLERVQLVHVVDAYFKSREKRVKNLPRLGLCAIGRVQLFNLRISTVVADREAIVGHAVKVGFIVIFAIRDAQLNNEEARCVEQVKGDSSLLFHEARRDPLKRETELLHVSVCHCKACVSIRMGWHYSVKARHVNLDGEGKQEHAQRIRHTGAFAASYQRAALIFERNSPLVGIATLFCLRPFGGLLCCSLCTVLPLPLRTTLSRRRAVLSIHVGASDISDT